MVIGAPMDKLVKSPPLQGGNYGFEPRWEYSKKIIYKSDLRYLKETGSIFYYIYMNSEIIIKQVCPKCGKEFELTISQTLYNKGQYRKYCSRSCANSRQFTNESRKKKSDSIKAYYSHKNNDLTYYGNELAIYECKNCGKNFTTHDSRDTRGRKYCSNKCREEWLKINLYSKLGGCRDGSGRSKSGWYKGIYCSSTWELAFLIYHLDHNLPIKRCTFYRTYEYNGVTHKYYPDFITNEGIIEIKGFRTKQWEAKQRANPDIITLYKEDMQKYIDYVKLKYTCVLEELYDDSKPIDKIRNRKYYWVHNYEKETMIPCNKLNEYLDNGWIKGRL